MQSINRVVLTGNLTRDPETRTTPSGTTICQLRIACNTRSKQGGEWVEKAHFFDVTCFGSLAENCHKYLARGRSIALDGRLDWHEWTTNEGAKRQAVQVVADTIQFLGGGDGQGRSGAPAAASTPVDSGDFGGDFAPSAAAPLDDDIPF